MPAAKSWDRRAHAERKRYSLCCTTVHQRARAARLRQLVAMAIVVLLSCCWTRWGRAAQDPSLQWWTIETEHFHIHYDRQLEPIAVRVARLSEDIHHRLVKPLGHTPSSITHIALTDWTDSANGSATGVPYNAIRLFVTAPADLSPLGEYDDWLLSLITHEYTHILHIDNVSGVPAIVNAVLGKTLIPNQVQPRWFIEGLAVVAESQYTSAGRIESSLFDMFLRADVLADNIAGLDQISSSARRWPQGSLWYLYGSRFLRWIADVYGQDALRAVLADYGASVVPWGLNRAIRRQTGRSYIELYEGFKDHLRRQYARQMKAVRDRGERVGRRITHHHRNVMYPHFVPATARSGEGRYELSYYLRDFNQREGHYRIALSGDGRRQLGEPSLWARVNNAGPIAFSPDGDMLVSSVVNDKRIYQRNDLFSIAPKRRAPRGIESYRTRLTKGARAVAPTVSPNGRQLVYTVNSRGTTRLVVSTRSAQGQLGPPRTLVKNKRYEQAYTPVFSPDGHWIAYSSWSRGGYRDVQLVSFPDGKIKSITHDRALDTNPCWSPDGKTLYFSSDRSGIFNIYAYTLSTGELRQVTNVQLGALMPTVSDDGKVLVYVGYTHLGYDLYAITLDPSRYLNPIVVPATRNARRANPPPVKMRKHPYHALTTLKPRNYLLTTAPGRFSANAVTFSAAASDIAGHHAIDTRVTVDPGAPAPEVGLAYRYLRLPFDLNVSVDNGLSRRTDFRINDQRPEYIERRYSVSTGISYSHIHEFATQSFSLNYTATVLDSALPITRVAPFDPYASATIYPFRGFLSMVRLGYSFNNIERSFDSAGSIRGSAVNLSLDVGDESIGSSESIYAVSYSAVGYMAMPWPGHHTLALRSSGGMSKGSYSRRGVYSVGGYNLERATVIDTLAGGPLFSGFALRGYPPGAFSGSNFMLQNAEYRIPLVELDRGVSTLPLYFRRLSSSLFFDYGGAFDDLDFDAVEWFSKGSIIYSQQLQTAAGVELWLDATVGYALDMQLRLGYAYGFSSAAEEDGQLYFVSSAAF